MLFLTKLRSLIKPLVSFLKWVALGLIMGVVGGLIGTAFYHTLNFVTGLRQGSPWLIFLLPLGGALTVGIYYLLRLKENHGTNDIIDLVLSNKRVSFAVAPAIYLSTAITHLFGGSAGREGAALQMGGSVASTLGRALRLKNEEQTALIISGMSAVFAGIFGTPLTACLFTMEFEAVGSIFSPALLPCFLSALVASKVAGLCGVHAETAVRDFAVDLNLSNTWKFVLLGIVVSLLGVAVCFVFHKAEYLAEKYIKSPWLRIVLGAVIIVALSFIFGNGKFNGAGMEMALSAIEGNAKWYFFAIKIIFTAITLAAGFKGGEIVPTFCIGATFGAVLGPVLGIDAGFAAALCLVGLFCATTNSPLASIALALEIFGSKSIYLFVLICVIAFAVSGRWGLYKSQIFRFSKLPTAESEKK